LLLLLWLSLLLLLLLLLPLLLPLFEIAVALCLPSNSDPVTSSRVQLLPPAEQVHGRAYTFSRISVSVIFHGQSTQTRVCSAKLHHLPIS
jgi:hypothetical protein